MSEPLSLHQLARRLRLDREWLKHEALAGRLPCLPVGRKLLFELEAVKQALAERAASTREVPHVV
jgi:hypothetical protein